MELIELFKLIWYTSYYVRIYHLWVNQGSRWMCHQHISFQKLRQKSSTPLLECHQTFWVTQIVVSNYRIHFLISIAYKTNQFITYQLHYLIDWNISQQLIRTKFFWFDQKQLTVKIISLHTTRRAYWKRQPSNKFCKKKLWKWTNLSIKRSINWFIFTNHNKCRISFQIFDFRFELKHSFRISEFWFRKEIVSNLNFNTVTIVDSTSSFQIFHYW